ncbi:MAG TPA: hypothetical protein VHT05_00575 [Candidatus Elarobacter sp.]|jgi:ribosomal protein L28|nr:hypothetical protein [Candidatus Elarobacter sp.]
MTRILSALVAAALAAAPLAAQAAISPGTDLVGNLQSNVDSKNAVVGQRVVIGNVHSQNNDVTGAVMYAHVCDVQSASQGRAARLQICIDTLRTHSSTYALNGRVVAAQVNTKNNTLNEVGGAVAGMILGNIIGKRVGTNAGGLLGAGGGYLYAKNAKQNVTMPAGSTVTVQVLSARRQATH